MLYSVHWARLLRPSEFARWRMERGKHAWTSSVVRPLCRLVDRVVAHVPGSPFRHSPASLSGEELDAETLLACLSEFSRRSALRPEYDARALRWLLTALVPARGEGSLRKTLVRDGAGQVLGWYLYYVSPAGFGEALHIGARDESMKAVLEHLFQDAWRRGACSILAAAGCWSTPATRRSCRRSIAGMPCSRASRASGACDSRWRPGERLILTGVRRRDGPFRDSREILSGTYLICRPPPIFYPGGAIVLEAR